MLVQASDEENDSFWDEMKLLDNDENEGVVGRALLKWGRRRRSPTLSPSRPTAEPTASFGVDESAACIEMVGWYVTRRDSFFCGVVLTSHSNIIYLPLHHHLWMMPEMRSFDFGILLIWSYLLEYLY